MNCVRLLIQLDFNESKNNHTFIERKLDRQYINIKYQCIIFIQFYSTESDITFVVDVFD